MEILFKRRQEVGQVGKVSFKLWCKIELDENEHQVVKRYGFNNAKLIDSRQPYLVRQTIVASLLAIVLATGFFSMFTSFDTALVLGPIIGIVAGYFYYDKIRETVYVKDLLHGRYFDCESVIELARKEAWLELITGFLRQVMESAKHWDGTQRSEIEVLPKEEAKRLIIRGLYWSASV